MGKFFLFRIWESLVVVVLVLSIAGCRTHAIRNPEGPLKHVPPDLIVDSWPNWWEMEKKAQKLTVSKNCDQPYWTFRASHPSLMESTPFFREWLKNDGLMPVYECFYEVLTQTFRNEKIVAVSKFYQWNLPLLEAVKVESSREWFGFKTVFLYFHHHALENKMTERDRLAFGPTIRQMHPDVPEATPTTQGSSEIFEAVDPD